MEYHNMSELDYDKYKEEWQPIIDGIKKRKKEMVHVSVDNNTVLKIHLDKDVYEVVRKYKKERNRFYESKNKQEPRRRIC